MRASERTLPERRPLIVATDEVGHAAAVAELTGAGWTIGDADPGATGVCRVHPVRNRTDAQAVVVAAVRGDAVLAVLRPGPDADPELDVIADDLVEDLADLGGVLQLGAANAVRLDAESWRLAHEVARGSTLESAARALHLSTRTANRRLTDARRALGAESRAQLVRALGTRGRVPPALTDR